MYLSDYLNDSIFVLDSNHPFPMYIVSHFSMIVEKSALISIIMEIFCRTHDRRSYRAIIFLFVLGIKQVGDFHVHCNRYHFKLK